MAPALVRVKSSSPVKLSFRFWSLAGELFKCRQKYFNTLIYKGCSSRLLLFHVQTRRTNWVSVREMTKRGAQLDGVPYGVPKMEYPLKSCIGQIKYFRNMANRLDVHTYIYFELASSPIVPVYEFTAIFNLKSSR